MINVTKQNKINSKTNNYIVAQRLMHLKKQQLGFA